MTNKCILELVVELAESRGDTPLNKFPDCWEMGDKDDGWYLAGNAHSKPRKCSAGPEVEPFNFYVQWNGFPAGSFGIMGDGIIAAGELANEETFKTWLREQTADTPQEETK